jgi:hypothetical protein
MITSKLQGGLGNQMFQIATAYALSKEIGTSNSFDFNQCYTPNQGYNSEKYENNFFYKLENTNIDFEKFIQYNEPKFSYQKLPLIDNLCINGYFQSEKYFLNYKEEISSLFTFDNKIFDLLENFISKKIKKKFTVVHVRRGDYLSNPNYHNVCNLDYYNKSIKKIDNNNNFIIISDDIEWCKENMSQSNIFFSEFNSEIYDLHLMLMSENIIMSNSSFSWWGAWLNTNKNKTIICPEIWFGPSGPQDIEDLIPNNWLKL